MEGKGEGSWAHGQENGAKQDAPATRGVRSAVVRLLAPERQDLGLLLVLLALAAGLRAWQIRHTAVISSDSLAFIRYAWRLEHQPWREVIRSNNRHPGYPVTIRAASWPVRQLLDLPESMAMQLSAQLASAAASILLVLPMFYLGRELFDRFVAFWACALFQCLPSSSRVLADGLSESAFLLFAVAAFLAAARGLRGGRALPLALCGTFGGLAYLTRPEGALVPAAAGLVLLLGQAVRAWRRPWRRVLACGLSLAVAGLVVAGPYIAATGKLTVKPTVKVLADRWPAARASWESVRMFGTGPLFASTSVPGWEGRGWRGLGEVVREFVQGGFYVAWLPALLGLWWFRDRFRLVPGTWVLAVVCLVVLLLLWRVAAVLGYVSERHLMLVILCGAFWAVAGLRELPRQLTAVAGRLPGFARAPVCFLAGARFTVPIFLLLLIAAALPRSLAPLHADRAGFRTAGLWLAEHTTPADRIIDPNSWASYYAGRPFRDERAATPGSSRTCYVVLPRPVGTGPRRLRAERALELAPRGKEVFRTPLNLRKGETGEVVVYAVPLL